MKKNQLYILLFFLLASIIISSCQKDDYFKDSGIVANDYQGSTLDYLKEKNYLFDSLVKVIDLAGMSDVISNDSITFFAPADSCFKVAITQLNTYLADRGQQIVTDLAQIKPQTWKSLLSMYIFKGKHMAAEYPQLDFSNIQSYNGQAYESYNNARIMNIGTVYNSADGVAYAGYKQVYLSFIPSLSAPLVGWYSAPVATSDIKTKNGILHVLQFTQHSFGFYPNFFRETIINDGIQY